MSEHFKTATALMALLDLVDRGEALRIRDIQERINCGAATAARYREWVGTQRVLVEKQEGRIKVWYKVFNKNFHSDDIAKAAALAFAVDLLGELKGTPHYRHVEQLAQQYRGCLPDGAILELDRITQNFRICGSSRSLMSDRQNILCMLMEAIENRYNCMIDYLKETGVEQRYSIQPWGLILHRNRLIVVAGRESSKGRSIERRFFNVDGIQNISLFKDEHFSPPARKHLNWEEIFRESFGIYAGWADDPVVDANIQVRGRHKVNLQQREVHSTQHLGQTDDEWLTVNLRVRPCPEFLGWVLSMIPNVRVVGPPHLREKICNLVDEWLRLDRS